MTTELTQPPSELGPAPADGQGQSQGHRHRRRRRKNKNSQSSAAPVQSPQLAVEPEVPAPSQPLSEASPQPRPVKRKTASPHPSARLGAHPGGRQAGHQSEGRKKKFFQKGSAAAAQPGNSISAPSPGRRKSRQKGPKEFVGPMDHSYRVVDGNIADGPPSTIQLSNGGYNGGYYQEAYQPPPPAPIREDAPTRIFCFIEDLFFLAKIQEAARKLGVKVEFVKGDKETLTRLTDTDEAERPKLLVFDLNNLNAKPLTLIPKFKAKLKKATSIIGFLNHLQGELKAKAVDVGCDTVMPRSAFSQSLPNLLRRYGLEEEEDHTPQPV
jgi:hypothetical protein